MIDITKCREETPSGGRCDQATPLDNQNIIKEFKAQIQKPQEERSPAYKHQQVFCDKELLRETKNTSPDSPKKFNKGNVFLLDATKEGNVGRFLNVSIWADVHISEQLLFYASLHGLKFMCSHM